MPDKIVVASHRRSGTHWTIDAVRNNFSAVRTRFLNLDRLLPWHEDPLSIAQFRSFIESEEKAVVIKTHSPATLDAFEVSTDLKRFVRSLIDGAKTIYVYRDGRDVMVSLYYYMRGFDESVREMSFSEFIRTWNEFDCAPGAERKFDRIEYWRFHVEGWFSEPHTLEVAYEELHSNFEEVIARLEAYLNMESIANIRRVEIPPRDKQLGSLHKLVRRIQKITSQREEGVSSAIAPRKGTVGDWKQHFSGEDIALYNRISEGLLLEKNS